MILQHFPTVDYVRGIWNTYIIIYFYIIIIIKSVVPVKYVELIASMRRDSIHTEIMFWKIKQNLSKHIIDLIIIQ